MLLVRDMKDLRNQPVEDLSPANLILLRKFLMPEHSNNHPLQVGRPRGRWLPVWAPLLLQLCPPSHCVLPMTPQNQRHTHTHQGEIHGGCERTWCEKQNLSPWCCLCSSCRVWLGTSLSPAMGGHCSLWCRFHHTGFVFNSWFTCFKPQPLAGCVELPVRELQQVLVIAGGVPTDIPSCVSRRAPFFH